jgi:transcriptional regulator with XRE-family HTH domain
VRRCHFQRRHLQLSQSAIADRAGIPQPYVSGFERGVRTPTPDQLRRLAEALQLEPHECLQEIVVAGTRS